MRTRSNTGHIVTADPKHRRGWIPLRSVDMRARTSRLDFTFPSDLMCDGYSATLRMSNLMAVRRIMAGDEVDVVIYQDGDTIKFRGRVTGGKPRVDFHGHRRRARVFPTTRISIEVDLIPNNCGHLFLQVTS